MKLKNLLLLSTEMADSKSDLKTRITRIARNPRRFRVIAVFVAVIMLGVAVVACTSGVRESEPPAAEAETPTVTQEPVVTPTPTPEVTPENTDEALQNQIDAYFNMTKQELIEKEGSDFKVVQTGAEGLLEGLHYENLGLTFTFDDDNTLGFIDCDPSFKIYGVGTGMSFSEIMECLGDTEINEFYMEMYYLVSSINYQFGNSIYVFTSYWGDGSDSALGISSAISSANGNVSYTRAVLDGNTYVNIIGNWQITFPENWAGWFEVYEYGNSIDVYFAGESESTRAGRFLFSITPNELGDTPIELDTINEIKYYADFDPYWMGYFDGKDIEKATQMVKERDALFATFKAAP